MPDPFETAANSPDPADGASSGSEGGSGSSSGSEGAGGGAASVGAGEGNGDTTDKDLRVARPDHVPEKFWDKDKNTVKVDDVLKSYTELEKAYAKAKEPPKAPEKYDYKPSEKLAKEYNIKEVPADDPYMQKFGEYAKSKGFSQEQYQDFVEFYLDMEYSQGRSSAVAEFAKLGDEKTAIQRVKSLKKFGETNLTKDEQGVMNELTKTANGVALFEKLIGLATKRRDTVTDDPAIGEPLSEADLQAKMKLDAYHDPQHPQYASLHKEVQEGYERLFPAKK